MPDITLDGCTTGLYDGQKQTAIINILLTILQKLDPMADTDIQTYLNGCANCLHDGQKQTVIINLLSAIGDTLTGAQIGTVDPNGVYTGDYVAQPYVQWNGTDTILRVWYFTGTVGANTGWI